MGPPQTPPPLQPLVHQLIVRDFDLLLTGQPALPDGRYLHWDELRHRPPPVGLSSQEWWAITRHARARQGHTLRAMSECFGTPFTLVDLPSIQRALHDFDRVNVGQQILSAMGNPEARVEYQVRQLIEESISSSEIEGARPTTRELARQMLRENREPTTRDERMIVNNLRSMTRMQELNASGADLTVKDLLELHSILGDGALDVEGAEGVFRTPEHNVVISDEEGNVWHRPPPAENIEQRMEKLVAFANGDGGKGTEFVHPIVRAITAHFWLGYEHPFRDGNGRMARALYYWCMLRNEYEVAEFLSISGPIDRSPKAYYLAFAHTESDAGDLTYFVIHQLGVMQAAMKDLLEHLTKRAAHIRALSDVVAAFISLNHRQKSLLEHAIRHPTHGHSIDGHATSYRVHYMTARSDLADLETRGLLTSKRVQKVKRYYPSATLMQAAPKTFA